MSDIADRLRALGDIRTSALYHQRVILNQAADEIDRLNAQLAEARDAALEDAAKVAEGNYDHIGVKTKHDKCPHDRFGWEDCDQCAAAAIRALKGKT